MFLLVGNSYVIIFKWNMEAAMEDTEYYLYTPTTLEPPDIFHNIKYWHESLQHIAGVVIEEVKGRPTDDVVIVKEEPVDNEDHLSQQRRQQQQQQKQQQQPHCEDATALDTASCSNTAVVDDDGILLTDDQQQQQQQSACVLNLSPTESPHFKCSYCDKNFNSKRNLKQHEPNHTRPHSCSLCDYSAADKSKLVQHMSTLVLPLRLLYCAKE